MISFKPGVRTVFLKGPAILAAVIADQVYAAFGESELVVTSGTEGTHSPGSLHYVGLAIDLRLPNDRANCLAIRNELANRLGTDYDVVLEDSSGHLVGIEIKTSASIAASDFNALRVLRWPCSLVSCSTRMRARTR